jgi:hypothetical protein
LFAAAIAISGALYLSSQRNLPRDSHGGALLPSLASKLDAVTAVSVRRGSAAPVTLHQVDGHWTVAERADYPADVPKLRKLLLALSDAKIVEQKTSNPANFTAIGVEDPTLPGATGAEVVVTARDAKITVIVGKPVGAGNFARRGGENTSYSVEPGISFETEPRFWIESRLLDLTAAAIQSIQVKPADGPGYTVRREPAAGAAPAGATPPSAVPPSGTPASGVPPSGNFTLEGTPPNRKAADSAALAPSPTAFTGVSADDVSKLEDIDFSKASVASVTMSDGNVITLTGAVKGDKHWIRLQASKDPALNTKTAGRAFEIASYRFDAIFRPLEQLLVPKTPPPAASKAAPAKFPPTKKPVPAPTP